MHLVNSVVSMETGHDTGRLWNQSFPLGLVLPYSTARKIDSFHVKKQGAIFGDIHILTLFC